jgi:hypothetical protein
MGSSQASLSEKRRRIRYNPDYMNQPKISEDWLKKNGYKLKIAYSYAVVNKLNIKSKEDVLKILKTTDPENANEEQTEIYSKMLQLFANKFRNTVEKKFEEN